MNRPWIQIIQKHRLVIFLGAALLAVLILSTGLSQLQFGQSSLADPRTSGELAVIVEQILSPTTFYVLLLCTAPLIIFSFYLALTSKRQRKEKAKRSLALEIFAWLLLFAMLPYIRRMMNANQNGDGQAGAAPTPAAGGNLYPGPVFAPNPSAAAAIFIGSVLLILIAMIVWIVWKRSRPRVTRLDLLREEVEEALEEISAGGSLRNAIMRCYADMCRVLQAEQGINRQKDMTPREFEERLVEEGIPGEPVRQLTRLFEMVRYGAKEPDPREEQQALSALSAIVEACRRPV
jgi:hypothetical protein